MSNNETTQDYASIISKLFDESGNMKLPKEKYFDRGELDMDYQFAIGAHYKSFNPDSHIVMMYYADLFASQMNGNYDGLTLFRRSL
jgi:hypothetical protein